MNHAFILVGILLIAGWGRAAGLVLLLAAAPGVADGIGHFIHAVV